ncbi:hypothetical protein R5R35_004309 [Gryllus longicercus]|uniref:Neuropeptide-like 4 n=1 Tax=Gryllus longicercus TaxID=2509291 RepID=A0AAN9Z7X3_9ORTH|nr:Protein of unknown function [Gryllus bimaculatus]
MSKFVVLVVVALCAVVAAVSAVPFPFPAGPGPAPAPKEALKGAEQVYYAGYGVPAYTGYAAYPYAYYG